MDLFDKLSAGLKPLGGELFVDAFVSACQAESARRAAASRPQPVPRERPAPPPPQREDAPAGAPPEGQVLQDEVEAFMNRDSIEGADDAEVQEFLKERGGFDPTEIPDQ